MSVLTLIWTSISLSAPSRQRQKALLPVHLNGRVCDMERILALADKHGLAVIEDAAQALRATFDGKCAGSQGRAGCFSFIPSRSSVDSGDGGHYHERCVTRPHGDTPSL